MRGTGISYSEKHEKDLRFCEGAGGHPISWRRVWHLQTKRRDEQMEGGRAYGKSMFYPEMAKNRLRRRCVSGGCAGATVRRGCKSAVRKIFTNARS